jgi:hypothetical protein
MINPAILATKLTTEKRILAYSPAAFYRFVTGNTRYGTQVSGAWSQVNDLTPNVRHATQGTAANRPADSNGGATFDGINDVLTASAFLNGITGVSLFALLKLGGSTLNNVIVCGAATPGSTVGVRLGFDATPGIGFYRSTPNGTSVTTGVNRSGSSSTVLLSCRGTNASMRAWDNNTAGTESTTAWGANITAVENFTIGAATGGSASWFAGTVLAVVVFTSALSTTDQATMRTLVGSLGGLSL